MSNPEKPRGTRLVHPRGRTPDAQRDPLLRHGYGERLETAAEEFLLAAFDGEGRTPFGEQAPASPVLVSAAMHVLTRTAWTQPSDEQVRASIYLQNRERGTAEPPRRLSQGEEPGQRAA